MIPGLDGLRAIAFILVFLIHSNFVIVGWVGVLLFFVLSGFLITGILVDMKEKLPTKAFFIKFYGRRFLRIFPLYYFYLFLMLGLAYLLFTIGYRQNRMLEYFQQLPYALTYVYNFFTASRWYKDSVFINHFWSLSVEEQFYIFWPLLIFLTPKKDYKKLFIASIVAGPLMRMGLNYIYNHQTFSFLGPNPATAIYSLPFSHLDAFGFGAYISQYRLPRARQQFWVLLATIPVIGFITQYIATGSLGYLTGLGFPFPIANGYKQVWGYSLLNYFFAVTIYAVAREGLFNRFLEMPWLKYLGKISYGLYVYHFVLIFFAGRMNDFVSLSYEQIQVISAVPAFIATVLVAALSFKYLEKPIINLKDKFFPAGDERPRSESGTVPIAPRLNDVEKTP
jgi:peptidoglycan/LPS O-acetylase OafA/YrhL